LLVAVLLWTGTTADARRSVRRIHAGELSVLLPSDSPVNLIAVDNNIDVVDFGGRFMITGPYSIECSDLEEEPCALGNLRLVVEPDANLLKRLPQWDLGWAAKPLIEVSGADGFINAHTDARTLAALRQGKIWQSTGYGSFVVEGLTTEVSCEVPWYGTRFVSFAPASTIALREPEGSEGCG